jgi:gamma-glutamyltranspeptidase
MFTDPKTGDYYKEGDTMKNDKLALTYTTLAASTAPLELFYHGYIMRDLVQDIQTKGSNPKKRSLDRFAT